MRSFNSLACLRWQQRGMCHCCEFSTNWIALMPDERDYVDEIASQDVTYLTGNDPILADTGSCIGTRVQCTWNPAVKGKSCPWRPLDCRLYPFSPARLLDDNGNVQVELWVGEKCPLYHHEHDVLLGFVPVFVHSVRCMRDDVRRRYDAWFRAVTPKLEGYVPFITWR